MIHAAALRVVTAGVDLINVTGLGRWIADISHNLDMFGSQPTKQRSTNMITAVSIKNSPSSANETKSKNLSSAMISTKP